MRPLDSRLASDSFRWAMTELFRYAAFISYSSKDAAFARRLHRALEGYGIPSSLGQFNFVSGGKSNRLYPVFRDREELSAGELDHQIEANLKASATLIVVCSPHSAKSMWVQREIEHFVSLGRRDKVFAIITGSAPRNDESGADATATWFPLALSDDALTGDKFDPLAADARKGKDGFRNALLKLIAGMIGVAPGQLVDRDRLRRRRRLFGYFAAVTLATLTLTVAYWQRQLIEGAVRSYVDFRSYAHTRTELMQMPPGSTFQDCREHSTNCPVMVVVPSGHLQSYATLSPFGRPPRQMVEEPELTIPRFAVSQNEITFAEWSACTASGGCDGYQPYRSGWPGDDRPVIFVSWNDAQNYVDWLSRMTGHEYRLLTEPEWVYAARAVTTAGAEYTRYAWGNGDPVCETSATNGAALGGCAQEGTWPVGSFRENAFGLFDMHGNVSEWLADCYEAHWLETPAVEADMAAPEVGEIEPACASRVLRGGSWHTNPLLLQQWELRSGASPGNRTNYVGFRIARTL